MRDPKNIADLPGDLEGTVITVASCDDHGAHVSMLAYHDGKPISVQQMTPEQATEVANDLMDAAAYAAREIVRHRAKQN
jgi:hypothetical protein